MEAQEIQWPALLQYMRIETKLLFDKETHLCPETHEPILEDVDGQDEKNEY